MDAPVDFTAVKTRLQAAWGTDDYAVIGTTLQASARRSPRPAT